MSVPIYKPKQFQKGWKLNKKRFFHRPEKDFLLRWLGRSRVFAPKVSDDWAELADTKAVDFL